MPGAIQLDVGRDRLLLLPERAAFRPADATLFVADLHVGKAATFRSHGVAIPPGTTDETLNRLGRLVAATCTRRVVILGDLLHAAAGRHARTEARLAHWCAARSDLRLALIRGNHDRAAGDPDAALGISIHDAPHVDGDVVLFHHPPTAHPRPWLAGHIHPGVRLAGAGRQRLTVPCFHVTGGGVVLPAFGAFTGLGMVSVAAGDQIFAIAGDALVNVTGGLTNPPADPQATP